MNQPASDSELVVATPERVSFDYKVAGLATRGIAQLLDLLILAGVLLGLYFAALAIGAAGADSVAFLVAVLGSFVVVFGYFWACEAFWSGQTVGKRVFRLRAVGDRGEPMTFVQAGIRSVSRSPGCGSASRRWRRRVAGPGRLSRVWSPSRRYSSARPKRAHRTLGAPAAQIDNAAGGADHGRRVHGRVDRRQRGTPPLPGVGSPERDAATPVRAARTCVRAGEPRRDGAAAPRP